MIYTSLKSIDIALSFPWW